MHHILQPGLAYLIFGPKELHHASEQDRVCNQTWVMEVAETATNSQQLPSLQSALHPPPGAALPNCDTQKQGQIAACLTVRICQHYSMILCVRQLSWLALVKLGGEVSPMPFNLMPLHTRILRLQILLTGSQLMPARRSMQVLIPIPLMQLAASFLFEGVHIGPPNLGLGQGKSNSSSWPLPTSSSTSGPNNLGDIEST